MYFTNIKMTNTKTVMLGQYEDLRMLKEKNFKTITSRTDEKSETTVK